MCNAFPTVNALMRKGCLLKKKKGKKRRKKRQK